MSNGLENKAFPFIHIVPRPPKPRQAGLTVMADRGMGSHRLEDLLETSADYIDIAKMGIGGWRLMSEDLLRRKIDRYHASGIKVFLAGDASEAAFLQGQSQRFFEAAKALGADAVEVSSAQAIMSLADKCKLIRMASDVGLTVIAEAGQKAREDWTESIAYVLRQIDAYRAAGAWKVLIQAEGVSEDVDRFKSEFVLGLVARHDVEDLIFQAKDAHAQLWYVSNFGNVVNLDVDDHQVLDLELLRRGIRKRGIFGLLGAIG
ncbi:phosphosulfolactate synthase [Dongia sp.]|uniref:phosphosulfolactate synthase n=1 Tax=Dongia sp. TaxID=1977262 RepID=UPI0035B1A4EF